MARTTGLAPLAARLATPLVPGGLLALSPPPTLAAPSSARFLELLDAPGAPRLAGKNADLYDALLGDWEGEAVDHLPDGTDRRHSVEMHFARVLEGRAVQDLWIVPAARDRAGAKTGSARRRPVGP